MERRVENRQVVCGDQVLEYQLTIKAVKNINLRIKPDGTILVSANSRVPKAFIDDMVCRKQEFIFRALDKYAKKCEKAPQVDKETHKKQLLLKYPKEYQRQVFQEICDETYTLFRKYRVPYPELKIRYMTTRWGSCQPQKGIITLNSQLIEKPRRCIEYVVLHEFAHFIHPNHSKDFYALVESLMPDWKVRSKSMGYMWENTERKETTGCESQFVMTKTLRDECAVCHYGRTDSSAGPAGRV